MVVKISDWDASEYLETEADVVAYLNTTLEDGNSAVLQATLGDMAKARGMVAVTLQAGVGCESLYRSLTTDGNPSWRAVTKVLAAMGLQLEIKSPVVVGLAPVIFLLGHPPLAPEASISGGASREFEPRSVTIRSPSTLNLDFSGYEAPTFGLLVI